MEYIIDGKRFKLSYSELKEEYYKYASMCNEDFIANASKVLHLVCIIAYLKEIPNYLLLADTGLITLPTTTTISKTTYVGCIYNSTDTKFDVIASLTEA
jgi:hypothetical protein